MNDDDAPVDDPEALVRKVAEFLEMPEDEVRRLSMTTLRGLAKDIDESVASGPEYFSGDDIREMREFCRSLGIDPA